MRSTYALASAPKPLTRKLWKLVGWSMRSSKVSCSNFKECSTAAALYGKLALRMPKAVGGRMFRVHEPKTFIVFSLMASMSASSRASILDRNTMLSWCDSSPQETSHGLGSVGEIPRDGPCLSFARRENVNKKPTGYKHKAESNNTQLHSLTSKTKT